MRHFLTLTLTCLSLVIGPSMSAAQQVNAAQNSGTYRYADVADLALASSVVAHVKIKKAERLKGAFAEGVEQGNLRFLITADVVALIRAPIELSRRISYIIDLPTDSRGRVPRLTKVEMMIFAVPGRGNSVQLAAPDAQMLYSDSLAQVVRNLISEASAPKAPPKITGVSSAFHTVGNLPGEGETQIFLSTEKNLSVSLNVKRQAGSPPVWTTALGEVVDDAVPPPARNTLLWYRLACFLPDTPPADAMGEATPEDAAAITLDYSVIMQSLGPCPRARKVRTTGS